MPSPMAIRMSSTAWWIWCSSGKINQVPIWVGKPANNNEWMAANIDAMEAAGVGWCHWTWKRHDVFPERGSQSDWGNYPTDGNCAMNTVLAFIHHNQIILNPDTRVAIAADLPHPEVLGAPVMQTTVPHPLVPSFHCRDFMGSM